MPKASIAAELPRIIGFLAVGGGGFAVHALVLFLMTRNGIGALHAWFPAFFCAVLFTWLLNRALAFKGLGNKLVNREAVWYFFIQSLGAGVNFIVYAIVIVLSFGALSYPIAALAAGSIAAAGFNYTMLRKFIYSGA